MSDVKHRFVVTTYSCEQTWTCDCMASSAEEAIEMLRRLFPEAPVQLKDALDIDMPLDSLNHLFKEVVVRQRWNFKDGRYAAFCD